MIISDIYYDQAQSQFLNDIILEHEYNRFQPVARRLTWISINIQEDNYPHGQTSASDVSFLHLRPRVQAPGYKYKCGM
jgi:hypothetical protein